MLSVRPGPCVVSARLPGGRVARFWSQGAFTLVELLSALAVVAILAAISIGAVRGAKERGNIARARSELAALATALEQFKVLYGDYPQTGQFLQARATPTDVATGPGLTTAQCKLFNCLTGVFGSKPDSRGNWTPAAGPNFWPHQLMNIKVSENVRDPRNFQHLNGTVDVSTFGNPSSPLSRTEQNVCLIDPWGRRYLYYYKSALNPSAWQASSYVLYSGGGTVRSDGEQTPPINVTSGLMLANQTAEMADNIYANP